MKLPVIFGLLLATSAQAEIRLYGVDCALVYAALSIPAEQENMPAFDGGAGWTGIPEGMMKVGRNYEAHQPSSGPNPEAHCSFKGDANLSGSAGFMAILDADTGEHLWQKLNVPAVAVPQPPAMGPRKFAKTVGHLRLERSVDRENNLRGTYVFGTYRPIRPAAGARK